MMKTLLRSISAAVLTVLMTAGFSSCVHDSYPSDQSKDDDITLLIRLGILDGPETRAEASDIECLSSVRIVLLDLDKDGEVEYNEKFSYSAPVLETEIIAIPTVKGKKQIFFIANEESVSLKGPQEESLVSLIGRYPAGADGFEDAIKAACFTLKPNLPLPMTSEYTLDAGRPGENNYTFYVVPAATKFTFHITNKREEGSSTIQNISFGDLADVNYVMPRVGQQNRDWTYADGSKTTLYWIDWLKNVMDNTKVPGNYEENQRLGWIFDYALPGGAEHKKREMFRGAETVSGVTTAEGGDPQYETKTFGPYYRPESKALKNSSDPNGPQKYTLYLELTDGTQEKISLSRELSNITALFRNTHVVIDITLEMGYMHVYGEIQPWDQNDVYGFLEEED